MKARGRVIQRAPLLVPSRQLPASQEKRDCLSEALQALASLEPAAQLEAAERRLCGGGGPLRRFAIASELESRSPAIDGRLLEAICARALGGARGAVFTAEPESRILAAFGLACAVEARGGPPFPEGVAMLLGLRRGTADLRRALTDLRVLDPACGGGALLLAAERLARRCGARLSLRGIDLAPLAVRACQARLALLGCEPEIRLGDALALSWPEADLVLTNPPFLRHETLTPIEKAAARRATGLPARADLSAHFAVLALRRSPVVAMVWPRALFTSCSAEPLKAEAGARGGLKLLLRSRAGGSFAASVDTFLAVWRAGATGRPTAEAAIPLAAIKDAELVALAQGHGGPRIRLTTLSVSGTEFSPKDATSVGKVCQVRFGLKTGCNGFFHLRLAAGDKPPPCEPRTLAAGSLRRYTSALAGEVSLGDQDVVPLLASLKEAHAPEWVEPGLWLFRPAGDSAAARAYVSRGEALGVHLRPTCAGRSPWWRVAPDRMPAPVLYPTKIGARAFAFLNDMRWYEDKKWHALFPKDFEGMALPPWLLAVVLSSTPVRLAVDRAARQLTGAQAIADVDCHVLAAAPFPRPTVLRLMERDLAVCRSALARDPVTTDLRTMLDRPAQRELDRLVARALGMGRRTAENGRREILERVEARLEHAAHVRRRLASADLV